MEKKYDIVVIGAGSGGLTAAVGFAKAGKKVLLVEREHMGGECTNSGCIPSKAFLHHAKTYAHAAELAGENAALKKYKDEALAYARKVRDGVLAEETPEAFAKLGIDVVFGEAVFKDTCSVEVENVAYAFKRAVIATGSRPRTIEIPGLEEADMLTNENFFEQETLPEKLLIIGGGPIAMELGQAAAMLGSDVTIATIDDRFPSHTDEALAPIVQDAFSKYHVDVLLRANITRVENGNAYFEMKQGETTVDDVVVPFDKVLIAIGRVPNIPRGLDAAGIEADDRGIVVDKTHRTLSKYVYAVGDVASKDKFTHTADDAARSVVTHVLSKGLLRGNANKALPKIIYTQPSIASVGLSWTDAQKSYPANELMRVVVPYSANDRAKTDSNTAGKMVVIAKRITGTVLGAQIVGHAPDELLPIYTLAIDRKISLWKLRSTIYAYPTYALLIKNAGDIFLVQQVATLKKDVAGLLKKHAPKLVALIFWGTLLWLFTDFRISNALSYQEMAVMVFMSLAENMWGPLVYILLYAIRPLIFFPATLLTVLGGAIFGFWGGIFYTIIGANLSANGAYWIGRFFGKDIRFEDTLIGNWTNAIRTRPFASILFMRLFFFPYDLVNYGAGVLRAPWLQYCIATIIGTLLGTATFVALGVSVKDGYDMPLSFGTFDWKYILLSALIFLVSVLLAKFLKRWSPSE